MNSVLLIGAAFCAALAIGCLLVSIARATKPKDEPKPSRRNGFVPLFDFSGIDTDRKLLLDMASIIVRSRLRAHITQRELAERAGVPLRLISSVEHGQPHSLKFLCKIAEALGVRVKIELEEK